MSCDPKTLVETAKCFSCENEVQLRMTVLSLLARWSANTLTQNQLLAQVSGFQGLSVRQLKNVVVALLVRIGC